MADLADWIRAILAVVIYDILPDHSKMLKRNKLVLVGKKVRELRLKAGYSQENFASDAGLERSYYGRVERGERNGSTLNLIKIAEALGKEVGGIIP